MVVVFAAIALVVVCFPGKVPGLSMTLEHGVAHKKGVPSGNPSLTNALEFPNPSGSIRIHQAEGLTLTATFIMGKNHCKNLAQLTNSSWQTE